MSQSSLVGPGSLAVSKMKGPRVTPVPWFSRKLNCSQGCDEDLRIKTPREVIDGIDQAARDEKIDDLNQWISMLPGLPVESICKINRTGDMQRCLLRCGRVALEQMIQSDRNFLNGCDNEDYNTLLHTAAQLNMLEMVRYVVLERDDVCIAKNKYGLTALDIISRRSRGHHDDNISEQIHTLLQIHRIKWEPVKENFFENKLDSIKLVASLIACASFQGGLNPPGGVLQEDKYSPSGDLIGAIGTSVMAFSDPHKYLVFWILNSLAFVCSMSILLLMMTGFRFKRTSMWFLSVGMWPTIAMMGYTYFEGLQFITPKNVAGLNKNRMDTIFISLWVGFASIILLMRINHYTKLLEKIKESNLFRSTAGFISWIFNNDHHATNQHNPNSLVNQNDNADLIVGTQNYYVGQCSRANV